jgi:GNAT superfamily N-acetyltransferase
MSLVYPNHVPENDLRLPDALTIRHGPRELIARLVLDGDRTAQRLGIRLRLRHDFSGLLRLTDFETARGNWYKLVNYLNPTVVDLTPENSYWISGENDAGEIVATVAGRVFYWPDCSLHERAAQVFFGGRADDHPCIITASAAREITGVAMCSGAMWVRPDYRRLGLSPLLARIYRAYGAARWPLDWVFMFAVPGSPEKVIAGYGYTDVSRSIYFPATDWGDLELALCRMSRQQLYDDLLLFWTRHLSPDASEESRPSRSGESMREDSVTSASPEAVDQGSISRS